MPEFKTKPTRGPSIEDHIFGLLDMALENEPRLNTFDHSEIVMGLTQCGDEVVDSLVTEWVSMNETEL